MEGYCKLIQISSYQGEKDLVPSHLFKCSECLGEFNLQALTEEIDRILHFCPTCGVEVEKVVKTS